MKAQPCFQGPFSLPALRKYSDCYSCVSRNLGRAHVKNLWSLLTRRIRYKYFLAKSTYLVMHFVPLYLGFDDKFSWHQSWMLLSLKHIQCPFYVFKCICSSLFLNLVCNVSTPFTSLIRHLLWIESVNVSSGNLFEIPYLLFWTIQPLWMLMDNHSTTIEFCVS